MSYRRRHRWFRRMALGLAFASVLVAGRASVAAAKFDEGTNGSRYVAAGGWSGQVDPESGIPLSAGIPEGDEQFIDGQAVQVIPYLSGGILTEADAQAAAAGAIRDPNLGRLDGDQIAIANAIESQRKQTPYMSLGLGGDVREPFVPGVTDFPTTQVGAAAVRPDDRADRFAHSDVTHAQPVSSSGSAVEWNDALTIGIGVIVLALGLALAVGYVRRPRLAGL
jgi:hypothetical protein